MYLLVDERECGVEPNLAVVAGFTGRDRTAVAEHIAELARHGVPPPAEVPALYRVPPANLTQHTAITAAHDDTSGEVEICVLRERDDWYVTVASDHTDRLAETTDIPTAKRSCPKVIGRHGWRLDRVADHWDVLELRSWADDDGACVPYQRGSAGELLALDDLLGGLAQEVADTSFALLCGTVPVLGEIRGARHFRAELHDPVTGDSVFLQYRVHVVEPGTTS